MATILLPKPHAGGGPPTPPAAAPEANPFSLRHYSPGVRKIANFGLMLFIVGLVVTGVWAPHRWPLSVLCGGAFMALGWAAGFLFGVPRTDAANKTTNTNLEQISDWLTKVLVGVGLTQLGQIPGLLKNLAAYIAQGYGSGPESTVFALSIVLYFSAIGFLTGYLLTRLALQPELEDADKPKRQVQVNTQQANVIIDQAENIQEAKAPANPPNPAQRSAADASQKNHGAHEDGQEAKPGDPPQNNR